MLWWNNFGEIRCTAHKPSSVLGAWKELPSNISRGNPKFSCDICYELSKIKPEQPKEFTGPVTTIAKDVGYGNQ